MKLSITKIIPATRNFYEVTYTVDGQVRPTITVWWSNDPYDWATNHPTLPHGPFWSFDVAVKCAIMNAMMYRGDVNLSTTIKDWELKFPSL